MSWRVDQGHSDLFTMVLYVRDAAGLEMSAAPEIPRLAGVPDLRSAVLDDGARVLAGQQWTSWFRQVLELELVERTAPTPGRNRAQYLLARHEAVCDPPDFAALADRPQLQAIARAVVTGHRSWSRSFSWRGAELEWTLLKQIAEDVAFDHRVSIDRVRARIVFVPVDGSWWTRVAPGCVLCSPAAAEHPVAAQALVRDAFVSGLTSPQ